MSRGSIDRGASEGGKGSETCGRKDGEEFRTARTQIRWMVDIPMRDRFVRPRDRGSLGPIHVDAS